MKATCAAEVTWRDPRAPHFMPLQLAPIALALVVALPCWITLRGEGLPTLPDVLHASDAEAEPDLTGLEKPTVLERSVWFPSLSRVSGSSGKDGCGPPRGCRAPVECGIIWRVSQMMP